MAGRWYASPPYNKNESRSLAWGGFCAVLGLEWECSFLPGGGRRWDALLGLPVAREYRSPLRCRPGFWKSANGWKAVRIATL